MKNKTSQICTHQNVPPAGGLAVFCKKTDWGVCECTRYLKPIKKVKLYNL